MTDRKLV